MFRDHFAGTTESLPLINIPLLPDEQAALVQVTRPLQLMRAAAWIIGRRWPAAGTKRLPQQPLPPLDCVRDGCAARVPARAMFGWVATACRRLASAPGDVLVSDRATWRVAGCVMERVSRGRVRRVQVQPQRRAAVSRHMCVCFVTGCCSKRWLTCRWRTAKRRSSMQRAAARRAFPPTRCLQCAVAASLGRYAAPGKHVVSAAPQPAAPTSALKRLAPDPSPLLQRHKGFIYASAHVHDVDGRTFIYDGCTPVGIDAGFEVAPGDASDVEVANAHAWGSYCLIFSDGTAAGSALQIAHNPSYKGIASYFSK